jgi:hypothetical protein
MKLPPIFFTFLFLLCSVLSIADTTVVVINGTSCSTCYAAISNLFGRQNLFIHIPNESQKTVARYINQYFPGKGIRPSPFEPDVMSGRDFIVSYKNGEVVSFYPIGFDFFLNAEFVDSIPISLELEKSSRFLSYSRGLIVHEPTFNTVHFIREGILEHTINFSDSSFAFIVYKSLQLEAEFFKIHELANFVGGALQNQLTFGSFQFSRNEFFVLCSLRRFQDNSIFSIPVLLNIDTSFSLISIRMVEDVSNFFIGYSAFEVSEDDHFLFVSKTKDFPSDSDYVFYEFKANSSSISPLFPLGVFVDQRFGQKRSGYNTTSLTFREGMWAYKMIPSAFCSIKGCALVPFEIFGADDAELKIEGKSVYTDYFFIDASKGKYDYFLYFFKNEKFLIVHKNGHSIAFSKLDDRFQSNEIFLDADYICIRDNRAITKFRIL